MYEKHLELLCEEKGMTVRTKAGILLPVTLLMAVGFFLMLRKGLSVPCVILAVIWVFHVIYFAFGVKTITEAEAVALRADAQPPQA